ncbi:MAG: hypothetical protein OJJ21_08215 [Ferrovibrio sp.]|uniref:hypothetical protein n=1 Tax=Ferrovibrio sp. TaxID=1917215 RepID=UPI00261D223B|nr:hypothetical protein [Ferrovibrio sp.]MCW0233566.1 hypothetical protein [Ferrovibrio sp.]
MHMLMMTVLGFIVLAVLWGGARFINARAGRTVVNGARLFLPVWAAVSFYNGYIGVTRAGYSVQAELLVHLVVFGLPAAVAVWLIWRGR